MSRSECRGLGGPPRMHAGSLEALRVTRPEAVDLEKIKHPQGFTPLGVRLTGIRWAVFERFPIEQRLGGVKDHHGRGTPR